MEEDIRAVRADAREARFIGESKLKGGSKLEVLTFENVTVYYT